MTNQTPKLLIGMFARNEERFIEPAILSLLAQSFTDFQLIISDNCSTDQTPQIIERIAKTDQRVILHRQPTLIPLNQNLNYVIKACRGNSDFFMLAGAHDLWHPKFLETCISLLEANPSLALAYARTMFIDENGTPIQEYPDDYTCLDPSAVTRGTSLLAKLCTCSVLHGVMRQSALANVGLIDEPMLGEDHIFLTDLILQGGFIQYPEIMFLRREVRKKETAEEQARRVARNWNIDPDSFSYNEGRLRLLRGMIKMILNSKQLSTVEQMVLTTRALSLLEDRFRSLSKAWAASNLGGYYEDLTFEITPKEMEQTTSTPNEPTIHLDGSALDNSRLLNSFKISSNSFGNK